MERTYPEITHALMLIETALAQSSQEPQLRKSSAVIFYDRYIRAMLFDVDMSIADGILTVTRMQTGDVIAVLIPEQDEILNGERVIFEIDASGSVTQMKVGHLTFVSIASKCAVLSA